MEKPRSWRRWPLPAVMVLILAATVLVLAASVLILAPLAAVSPSDEHVLRTQIADLEATRGVLSTELAEVEDELPETSARGIAEPDATQTELPPTPTATPTEPPTPTPTPAPTNTPVLPRLDLTLLGCHTGLDIAHDLGEVTNAYVRVQNVGEIDVTNVCVRLEASDVGGTRPDEERCVPMLPARTRIALTLTIDTEFRADTAIEVRLTSEQGASATVTAASCRELDLPPRWEVEDALSIVEPLSPG